MKRKVAVAMSDWLLDEVDERARKTGVSRSALVEEATAAYLAVKRSSEKTAAYRRSALAAVEDMRHFAGEAEKTEHGAPTSLEKLRALRASGRGVE